MPKNNLLESTTEKVSRVLTEKYGMNVIFRGTSCHTDGRTIYLPSLPEDVPEDLIGALRGWADHECSHALFTEIGVGAVFSNKHGPRAFGILNTLEDARVERLMSEKFPGSGINIRQGYEYITSGEPPKDIFRALTWALYSRAKGLEDFPNLPARVYKLLEGCEQELDQVLSCDSTSELATVAESIWLKLGGKLGSLRQKKQEQEQEPEQQDEAPGDCAEYPTGQSKPQEGDSDEDHQDESQPGRAGEEEEEKEEEETAESESAEGQQEEGEQNQEAGPEESEAVQDADSEEEQDKEAAQDQKEGESDSGDPQEDKNGDGQTGGESSGESVDENKEPGSEIIASFNLDTDPEPGEDASPMGQLKSRIEKAAEPPQSGSQSYRVYTTEHDVIDIPDASGPEWRKQLGEHRPQVAGLMRRLVHTLRGRSEKNWRRGQSRGMLDPGSLHKLFTEYSPRIFRTHTRRDDGPTACALLLDLSASMQGPRIKLCQKMGLIFGETLSRLSFPTEIIGFSTTKRDLRYEVSQETGMSEKELSKQYSRVIPLYHAVFKSFDEPWSLGASRMGQIRPQSLTPLGESLLFAGKRLARRPEQRKVLFCLTDGEPVTGAWDESVTMQHACDSVDKLTRAGIETVGIGIMERSVKEIFPSHAVIKKLNELPTTFARSLCSVLTERRRGAQAGT